ncbi:hypothetical protein TWF970_009592 [Orbilia oligospora]|uniref:Uncharacterized protein n=1 Tax=Orbilia oligospora TaxID=2813651 RepID=A0A7C8RDV7_ORBOL|nr:hypothetical protein TWF970_009592 [Orbilia oligospora]
MMVMMTVLEEPKRMKRERVERKMQSAIGEDGVNEEGCEVWRSFLAVGATPTRQNRTEQDRTGQDDYRPTQSPIPTGLEIHLAGKESSTDSLILEFEKTMDQTVGWLYVFEVGISKWQNRKERRERERKKLTVVWSGLVW